MFSFVFLSLLQVSSGAKVLYNASYSYDAVGNVTNLQELSSGLPSREMSYGHDRQYRLIQEDQAPPRGLGEDTPGVTLGERPSTNSMRTPPLS